MQNISIDKPFLTFDYLSPRNSTKFIVVHHTAILGDSSARDIHQSHLAIGYSGCGYHFVIRKNGAVERGRPVWAVGAHAYGNNANSVGICLSGNFEIEQPTTYQIESAALLIANVAADFNIPVTRNNVLAHREINDTACPGKFLFNIFDTLVGKAAWYFRN